MALRRDYYASLGDGLVAALGVVGPRWALLVVRSLLDGSKRYGDLQRELGAPTNMLATRLKELQEAGLLYRLPLAHNQRAYALTERGAELREATEALGRAGLAPFTFRQWSRWRSRPRG